MVTRIIGAQAGPSTTGQGGSASAEAEVRRVVQDYMDAIHAGDTVTLAQVFHPTATLIGWDEGELRRVTLEQWFAFVESIPSPHSLRVVSDARIVSVDVTGSAAVVKVAETYRRFHYVDYLSLLLMGDRWQVVHKCYHQFPPLDQAQPS